MRWQHGVYIRERTDCNLIDLVTLYTDYTEKEESAKDFKITEVINVREEEDKHIPKAVETEGLLTEAWLRDLDNLKLHNGPLKKCTALKKDCYKIYFHLRRSYKQKF